MCQSRNGCDKAQPSSCSTSLPICLQLSQLLGRTAGKRRTELLRLFPGIWESLEEFSSKKSHFGHLCFGVCSRCFWKAEQGVGIFQHDGAAARSLRRGSARPALPSPALVFPFFHHSASPRPWGSSGCVCSSGGDPNSCTWPCCTERSQEGRLGKPPGNIQNPLGYPE